MRWSSGEDDLKLSTYYESSDLASYQQGEECRCFVLAAKELVDVLARESADMHLTPSFSMRFNHHSQYGKTSVILAVKLPQR